MKKAKIKSTKGNSVWAIPGAFTPINRLIKATNIGNGDNTYRAGRDLRASPVYGSITYMESVSKEVCADAT